MVAFLEFLVGLLFRAFVCIVGFGVFLIGCNGLYKTYLASQDPAFQIVSELNGAVASGTIAAIIAYRLIWLAVGGAILFFAGRSLFRHIAAGIRDEAANRKPISAWEQLRGIIVFGIGALFFGALFAVRFYVLAWNVTLNVYGERLEAQVTEVHEVTQSDLPKGESLQKTGHYVDYRFTYGDKSFSGSAMVPRSYWETLAGAETVPVMFFADNPGEAGPQVNHDFRNSLAFMIKTLVFLVMAVIGFARLWYYLTYDDSGPSYQPASTVTR